jgi:hypothetical protein
MSCRRSDAGAHTQGFRGWHVSSQIRALRCRTKKVDRRARKCPPLTAQLDNSEHKCPLPPWRRPGQLYVRSTIRAGIDLSTTLMVVSCLNTSYSYSYSYIPAHRRGFGARRLQVGLAPGEHHDGHGAARSAWVVVVEGHRKLELVASTLHTRRGGPSLERATREYRTVTSSAAHPHLNLAYTTPARPRPVHELKCLLHAGTSKPVLNLVSPFVQFWSVRHMYCILV